jgi:uncharacterized protein YidB (DUF937 family)
MRIEPAKGEAVDPVVLIVTALAAGEGLTVPDDTSDAVIAAHAGLREAVCHWLGRHPGGESELARYEADPQAGRVRLTRELGRTGAGDDKDLVAAALAVIELVGVAGNHALSVSGSQGVQVGDNNIQVSYFAGESIDRLGAGSAIGTPAGRLLAEVTDPFTLEVHRPVQVEVPLPELPVLPTYVPRQHDQELAEVVQAAAKGVSGIAVLVGGSSTGKTRACWEALKPLREQPDDWRLWHPIDPSRPEAALRELASIGPRTVIWLNEAQFYLDSSANGLGERVAAGLRELLRDPTRAPMLVLATMWPQFWDQLTTRPPAGADDPHAQARELLAARDIAVPTAFTASQLPLLGAAGDPRLSQAGEAAEDGRVIQFLAGAPELITRYRNASAPAKAAIDAAMDARRLGMGIMLPLAFLEMAAPGYLTDTEWDTLTEDWLELALAYTAAPCKGARGPLTRIRPRTTESAPARGVAYRLADFLDQQGRHARRRQVPPASFWTAAIRFAEPRDLAALASAAEARGLLRYAAHLRKHATGLGDAAQGAALFTRWHSLNPHSSDPAPAQWVTAHVSTDDPGGIADLLRILRKAGADEQVAAVLARDPAARVSLEDPDNVAKLLRALRKAGADEQVAALLARDPAAHVSLEDPFYIAGLLKALRKAGAHNQTAALARRAATQAPVHDPFDVAKLLGGLHDAGAKQQAAALARRAADQAPLDDLWDVAWLLDALRRAGNEQEAAALARRAAHEAPLKDPFGVGALLEALANGPADDQFAAMLARDPTAHVSLDDPFGIAALLGALREVGADEQVAALLAREPAAHAPLDEPFGIAELLGALREAGADEQVAALLARDHATHVSLESPDDVAKLLTALQEAGADEQVAALLARDPAAHVSLESPDGVAELLTALREAGADEQQRSLVARLPAEGRFDLFLIQSEFQVQYRFGREPDGSPARPWRWGDLD